MASLAFSSFQTSIVNDHKIVSELIHLGVFVMSLYRLTFVLKQIRRAYIKRMLGYQCCLVYDVNNLIRLI